MSRSSLGCSLFSHSYDTLLPRTVSVLEVDLKIFSLLFVAPHHAYSPDLFPKVDNGPYDQKDDTDANVDGNYTNRRIPHLEIDLHVRNIEREEEVADQEDRTLVEKVHP